MKRSIRRGVRRGVAIGLFMGVLYLTISYAPSFSSQLQARLLGTETPSWHWTRFEAEIPVSTSSDGILEHFRFFSSDPTAIAAAEPAMVWIDHDLMTPAGPEASSLERENLDTASGDAPSDFAENVVEVAPVTLVSEEIFEESPVQAEVEVGDVGNESVEPSSISEESVSIAITEIESSVESSALSTDSALENTLLESVAPVFPPATFVEKAIVLADALNHYFASLNPPPNNLPEPFDLVLEGDFSSYFYSIYFQNERSSAPVAVIGFQSFDSQNNPEIWVGWSIFNSGFNEVSSPEEILADSPASVFVPSPPVIPDEAEEAPTFSEFPMNFSAMVEWQNLSDLNFKLANAMENPIITQGQDQLLEAYWVDIENAPSLNGSLVFKAPPYAEEDSGYAIPPDNFWVMKGDIRDEGLIYEGEKYFIMDSSEDPSRVRIFLLFPAHAPAGVYRSALKYTSYAF